MSNTRSGEMVSPQIAVMGTITDLATSNFSLSDGNSFQIKNDSYDVITLNVRLSGMADGEFVATNFGLGWNPEIVREIKSDANLSNYSLKWGY